AVLAGWYVTEIGRQPWVVTGLVTTAEVVADHPPSILLITLSAYFAMYAFLLVSYISAIFYMSSKPARSLSHIHNYGLPGKHPEDRAYSPISETAVSATDPSASK
ncbi:MAG: cytochrome d ubiquinol oxidase subunit I, partial [Arenicella sp.]